MAKFITVRVEVPELAALPVDPEARAQLDTLCAAARAIQAQIKPLEAQIKPLEETKSLVMADLKPLAESLGLPERVLGESWDLRRVTRVTEKINADRLTMRLLQLGFGLDAAKDLVAECTDRTESASWSVYGRDKSKEGGS